MAARLSVIFQHLIEPPYMMLLSASYLPTTVAHLLRTSQFSVFLSPSKFKGAWFAQFWAVFGPEIRMNATPRVAPIFEEAHGIVLDIGPGSGEFVRMFDPKTVTKVFGVEPNKDHHARLKENIEAAGLEGIYEILPVGVEALGNQISKGQIDTIVTIQCLCSIPAPKKMIDDLYGYLKEGGTWILYEHVVAFPHQGKLLGIYQRFMDLFWPTFYGGCSITRDTGRWVKEAGPWSKVLLKQPDDEDSWAMVPHLVGVLTK